MTTLLGLLITFSTALTSTAFAGEVVKTCTFTIKIPDHTQVIPTTYQIIKEVDKLVAKTTQIESGRKIQLDDEVATIDEFTVRPDLTEQTPGMNTAEYLIQGTENFLNNSEIGNSFTTCLDLKLIRTAKVYQIGKFTHMGGAVVIEARNQAGNEMGSFVTGLLPFACEK